MLILLLITIIFFIIFFKNTNCINLIKNNWKIFIVYLLLVTIIYLIIINIPIIKHFILKSNYPGAEKYILLITLFSICSFIVSPICYLMNTIKEKRIIKKYESQFEITKFEYYRDFVGDISPAILATIFKKSNYKDMLIATIIYLSEKDIISYKNNQYVFNGNYETLLAHERRVVDYLCGNKNGNIKKDFKNSLQYDLENEGYIFSYEDDNNIVFLMEVILVFLLITILILSVSFFSLFKLGPILIVSYVIVFVNILIYKGLEKYMYIKIKTNKALLLNAKLNGLYNYLKDFTIINERKVLEIKLYNDYIIYAIIFNVKGKLNDECLTIYNNIQEKLTK